VLSQATQLCQAPCHPRGSGTWSQSHVSTWRSYSPNPSHGFSGGLNETSQHHVTFHQYCSPCGSSPLKMATPGTSVQEPLVHILARPWCYLKQPSSAKLHVIAGAVGPGLSLTSALRETILLTLSMVSQVV
jgi:hypothetical protein